MEERNVTITLDKAIEWYNSNDTSLREIALQAFNENELMYNFKNITSFKDACKVLNLSHNTMSITVARLSAISKASAAMFILNIVRKALNLGQNLYLTKGSSAWYPNNLFITKDCTHYRNNITSGELKIIGKFENEGIIYSVLGGSASFGIFDGIGDFDSRDGTGCATSHVGFLGCASKEIAQHFSIYFGMLITEAKYGDIVDLENIESYIH